MSREADQSPTTAVIDSQTAKAAHRGGGATLDPSGFAAAKKAAGRKRHLLTDTLGLLLAVVVRPADAQDRDGAEPLLRQARRLFPFIERGIGWISRNRRLARDFERHCRIAAAFVRVAMIRITRRRLPATTSHQT